MELLFSFSVSCVLQRETAKPNNLQCLLKSHRQQWNGFDGAHYFRIYINVVKYTYIFGFILISFKACSRLLARIAAHINYQDNKNHNIYLKIWKIRVNCVYAINVGGLWLFMFILAAGKHFRSNQKFTSITFWVHISFLFE